MVSKWNVGLLVQRATNHGAGSPTARSLVVIGGTSEGRLSPILARDDPARNRYACAGAVSPTRPRFRQHRQPSAESPRAASTRLVGSGTSVIGTTLPGSTVICASRLP